MLKQLYARLMPYGLQVILNSYFRYPRKKRYRNSGKIEIGTPILVNPKNVEIDDYVRIQNNVKLITSGAKLRVKKYSAIGEGCVIIPGAHTPTVGLPQYLSTLHINDVQTGITINEDCWIGAEAALLSKCNIGRGAVVGARSVVTKDIPPYAVVAGMPAKIIACRFSIAQIIEHEKLLYQAEERMSETELVEIFEKYYKNIRSIGTSEMSESDKAILEQAKEKLGIIINN